MANDQEDREDREAMRAAVRERYLAHRARIDAIPDEEWAARRDAEIRIVEEWVAAKRRSAA